MKLGGTVIIVANEGQRIDIPDNSVLENRKYPLHRVVYVLKTLLTRTAVWRSEVDSMFRQHISVTHGLASQEL